MAHPVAVRVWFDGLPFDIVDGAGFDDVKFLFAGEIVADVAVVDLNRTGVGSVFDADEDCDGRATSGSEDFAAFSAGEFASGALVAAQVVDPEVRELVGETEE